MATAHRVFAAALLMSSLDLPARAQLGSAIGGAAANQSSLGGGMCYASPSLLSGGQQAAVAIDCATHQLLVESSGGGTPATVLTQPLGATSTDASGTVTAGGTYQTIQAATATRKGCTVQNPLTATETLNVRVGTTTAFFLAPGSTFNCEVGGIVVTDAIAVTAATTAHAFAANFQ